MEPFIRSDRLPTQAIILLSKQCDPGNLFKTLLALGLPRVTFHCEPKNIEKGENLVGNIGPMQAIVELPVDLDHRQLLLKVMGLGCRQVNFMCKEAEPHKSSDKPKSNDRHAATIEHEVQTEPLKKKACVAEIIDLSGSGTEKEIDNEENHVFDSDVIAPNLNAKPVAIDIPTHTTTDPSPSPFAAAETERVDFSAGNGSQRGKSIEADSADEDKSENPGSARPHETEGRAVRKVPLGITTKPQRTNSEIESFEGSNSRVLRKRLSSKLSSPTSDNQEMARSPPQETSPKSSPVKFRKSGRGRPSILEHAKAVELRLKGSKIKGSDIAPAISHTRSGSQCSLCGKAWLGGGSKIFLMIAHAKVHVGSRFKCLEEQCEFKTYSSSNFKAHRLKQHGIRGNLPKEADTKNDELVQKWRAKFMECYPGEEVPILG